SKGASHGPEVSVCGGGVAGSCWHRACCRYLVRERWQTALHRRFADGGLDVSVRWAAAMDRFASIRRGTPHAVLGRRLDSHESRLWEWNISLRESIHG